MRIIYIQALGYRVTREPYEDLEHVPGTIEAPEFAFQNQPTRDLPGFFEAIRRIGEAVQVSHRSGPGIAMGPHYVIDATGYSARRLREIPRSTHRDRA